MPDALPPDSASADADTMLPGHRPTRQRLAVSAALAELDSFRGAQEIHEVVRRRGDSVGLSTVYRTLQALADNGEVDVLRKDDGETLYRRCSRGHHHHLVCRACGRTVEVEGAAVEHWADMVAERHGFHDVSHTLEVFGTCAECHDRDVRRFRTADPAGHTPRSPTTDVAGPPPATSRR